MPTSTALSESTGLEHGCVEPHRVPAVGVRRRRHRVCAGGVLGGAADRTPGRQVPGAGPGHVPEVEEHGLPGRCQQLAGGEDRRCGGAFDADIGEADLLDDGHGVRRGRHGFSGDCSCSCVLRCSVDELKGNDAASVVPTELIVERRVERVVDADALKGEDEHPERGGLVLEAGGLEDDAGGAEHGLSKEDARGFFPSHL